MSAMREGEPPEGAAFAIHNRKYLGSKYRLLGFLEEAILERTGGIDSFVDGFAGTGVVAARFRRHASCVVANDLLYSNYVANRAFLACPPESLDPERLGLLLAELNGLPPRQGYASRHYGGTYFTAENAGRIDAIRERLEELRQDGGLGEEEYYVLLTSLLYAADKAANTVGQYDAFLKHLEGGPADPAGRHLVDGNVRKPLILRMPRLEPGTAALVYNRDLNELIEELDAQVLYLDPPYNGRQYVDCYHVLENILRWEKPRLYGKTRKFARDHLKSRYSRRADALAALQELVDRARAEHIFLSYNNEGLLAAGAIREVLERRGPVEVVERGYAVFGNGAGSAVRRQVKERLFHCRTLRSGRGGRTGGARPAGVGWSQAELPGLPAAEGRARQAAGPGRAPAGGSRPLELFDGQGQSRGYYSPANRLNDLTGREWVYWTKSVITTPYPPNLQHRLRSRHGGQKPPQLCADLIAVFTKRGQRVLDPFAGVGGTLLGASLCGREAVGIELESRWVDLYGEVSTAEGLPQQRMLCGDSREVLPRLRQEGACFDLILTDVPYWRMDKADRSKGKYKRVGQAARSGRSSKLGSFNSVHYPSKEHWLAQLREVFAAALPLLRPRGYAAVFVGDMYHGGRYHFLSSDLAGMLASLGLTMKANLVWYDGSKSLHVYGYRYEFIPSMIHQNVLVFRKPGG